MQHSTKQRYHNTAPSRSEEIRSTPLAFPFQNEANHMTRAVDPSTVEFYQAGLSSELEVQGEWLFRWRSYLPLLFAPIILFAMLNTSWPFKGLALHEIWEMVCLSLSVIGLGIRVLAIGHVPAGTSGRNTQNQCAASLNRSGIYSVVRHPLYLGNYLIGLGAMMIPFVWWLPLLYSLSFAIYYERIMFAEECFLVRKFGKTFIDWAETTPAFLPRLWQWQPPTESFSVRNVLKREYTGLLVVILLHTAFETVVQSHIQKHFILNVKWELLLIAGLAVYLTLRSLKKYSSVLDVQGR